MFSPIYNNIADQIKDDIASSRWQDKLPGVGVLAKYYEVAPRTISKAIGVLADKGLVTTHGTRGTFITQTKAKRPRYGTIGVVGIHARMHGTSEALVEAEKLANNLGYQLMFLGVPEGLSQAAAYLHLMPVDGLIFTNSTLNEKIVVNLRQANMPFVSLNRIDDIAGISWVDFDNEQGLKLALEHLLALGHRRICYVSFKYKFPEHQRRAYVTYQQVLEQAGCFDPNLWLGDGDMMEYFHRMPWEQVRETYGKDMMQNILDMADPPTAGYVGDPNSALGMQQLLNITGRNDFTICAKTNTKEQRETAPFTQVATDDAVRMKRAIEILINLTIQPEKTPKQEFVPFELVEPQMALAGDSVPAMSAAY